jgi:peptide/nickel transport system ATP-binding protein
VDGVSFTLARGEAVAFVGESGCGKSSLARTLLGLHRPSRGEVRFEGRAMTDLHGRELKAYRARDGYVQQDPYGALPPFMDVRRLLADPLIVHGVKDRQMREHRIRALILAPAMLIADEPVSMLDASVRVEILELLRAIQTSRQLTLAFITHDLSTVRHFADRIFVMYAGRVMESAPVDELLDHPRHPYTQALINAIADPDARNADHLREVPEGEPPQPDPPARGVSLPSTLPPGHGRPL